MLSSEKTKLKALFALLNRCSTYLKSASGMFIILKMFSILNISNKKVLFESNFI